MMQPSMTTPASMMQPAPIEDPPVICAPSAIVVPGWAKNAPSTKSREPLKRAAGVPTSSQYD